MRRKKILSYSCTIDTQLDRCHILMEKILIIQLNYFYVLVYTLYLSKIIFLVSKLYEFTSIMQCIDDVKIGNFTVIVHKFFRCFQDLKIIVFIVTY